jgi:hypothetical protein
MGPMGEMLNRLQQDSLFQFSKNVRDKFSDLTMLDSNPDHKDHFHHSGVPSGHGPMGHSFERTKG